MDLLFFPAYFSVSAIFARVFMYSVNTSYETLSLFNSSSYSCTLFARYAVSDIIFAYSGIKLKSLGFFLHFFGDTHR